MSLTIKKTSGKTGRSGHHQINDKPTANFDVQEFVKRICNLKSKPKWIWILISTPLAWKFYQQVLAASQIGLTGDFFRGQKFPRYSPMPSSKRLGPPPLSQQSEGRYTDGKSVVLYLSRNEQTATTESRPDEEKPLVFIQRFSLDLPDLRVLRLTENLEETYPHLHYLLLSSEYLPDETPHLLNPYRATQFIAFLCRLRKVYSVEYPSVKGDYKNNPSAINLAVFGNYVERATAEMSGEPYQHPD